jgi:Spy/CpxP family protein refolding chaperone
MKNRLRGLILALSLSLNLAFIGVWLFHAVPGWKMPLVGRDYLRSQKIASRTLHQELGVTPEQWQQIEPLILQFRQAMESQHLEIITLRQQLLELLAATPADENAIRAKQEEILAGQRQMQNLAMEHLLKEKKILSPDQAVKLIQALCEQCRLEGGILTGHGLEKKALEKQHSHEGMDTKKKE